MSKFCSILVGLFLLFLPSTGNTQLFECEYWGKYYRVTAKSGLNLRKEPYLNADKVGTIPYGELVFGCMIPTDSLEIEGVSGAWIKGFYKDLEGYVFDGFLKQEKQIQIFGPDEPIEGGQTLLDEEKTYFGIYEQEGGVASLTIKQFNGRDTVFDYPAIGAMTGIINEEQAKPLFIITGLDLEENQQLYHSRVNVGMLFPGQAVNFGTSILYAVGEPVRGDGDFAPFKSIDSYQLILREKGPEDKLLKEEVLFDLDLHPWALGQYEEGVHIRWIGDLDGDKKMDILLSYRFHYACYDVALYLSSKAIGEKLVGAVAGYSICGC